MENCRYLVFELLYGAAVLTTITAAPDILMKLKLNYRLVSNISFSYPNIWLTMFQALLLTALTMLPRVVSLPNCLTRRRFFNFLPMAPWILICCFKFLKNVSMHLIAIGYLEQYNDSTSLIMALIIYCIIFGLAAEMMLHWIAIANMNRRGYVLEIVSELK
ncbi:hypothetical protein KR200_000330 [Drosophila serrata]|nr:hypothetical protein KR200_000330 [Drosophila serrata]